MVVNSQSCTAEMVEILEPHRAAESEKQEEVEESWSAHLADEIHFGGCMNLHLQLEKAGDDIRLISHQQEMTSVNLIHSYMVLALSQS